MSKNIILRRDLDGKKVLREVQSLQTKETEGYRTKWVWEDETRLTEITADKNGRYKPSKADIYGFSAVHVSLQMPIEGETEKGTYSVYLDENGRPHLKWERKT